MKKLLATLTMISVLFFFTGVPYAFAAGPTFCINANTVVGTSTNPFTATFDFSSCTSDLILICAIGGRTNVDVTSMSFDGVAGVKLGVHANDADAGMSNWFVNATGHNVSGTISVTYAAAYSAAFVTCMGLNGSPKTTTPTNLSGATAFGLGANESMNITTAVNNSAAVFFSSAGCTIGGSGFVAKTPAYGASSINTPVSPAGSVTGTCQLAGGDSGAAFIVEVEPAGTAFNFSQLFDFW